MLVPLIDLPLTTALSVVVFIGVVVGMFAWKWGEVLAPYPDASPNSSRVPGWGWIPLVGAFAEPVSSLRRQNLAGRIATEIAGGLLFGLTLWMLAAAQAQHIPEVAPGDAGLFRRMLFQLILVGFLLVATVTDLRDYLIPDAIVIPGIAIGVAGQFFCGDVQMQHLWLDWNAEIPGLQGPEIPAWIDAHRHLHGLAVALAGLIAGAGIIAAVRTVSTWLIGQETMGLGDVTFMAMIGSYLGWQPVLFVLLIAPLCGLVLSLLQRFLGGKHYLPFGPFLALATVVVLCSWKWLWTPSRYVFGHPPTLLGLIGGSSAAFVLLLILARLYRMIPVTPERRYSSASPAAVVTAAPGSDTTSDPEVTAAAATEKPADPGEDL